MVSGHCALCDGARRRSPRIILLHDSGDEPNEKKAEARILVVELEDLVLGDRIEAAVDFTDRAHGAYALWGEQADFAEDRSVGELLPELRKAHASFPDQVQPVGRIAFAEQDLALAMSLLPHVGDQRIERLAA